VRPPTRAGFGTRLIERGLAADLNGEVNIAYPVDGVVCTIRARLDPADYDGPLEVTPKPRSRRPAAASGAQTEMSAPA
jgi:hypothetical protein